jgi:hypothetical protein
MQLQSQRNAPELIEPSHLTFQPLSLVQGSMGLLRTILAIAATNGHNGLIYLGMQRRREARQFNWEPTLT